ncbi:MAG: hypothetical protein J5726_09035 [Treponema sp.]|nr:hypothetical protein [Treponema sp.]
MNTLRRFKKQLLFVFMLFAFAGLGFSQSSRTWSNDYRFYAYVQDSQVIVCDAEDGSTQLLIPVDFESILSIKFIEGGSQEQGESAYYLRIMGSSQGASVSQLHMLARKTDDFGGEFLEDYILIEDSDKNAPEVEAPAEAPTETPVEAPAQVPVQEAPANEPPAQESPAQEPSDQEAPAQQSQATKEETHEYEALALIRYKNSDTISFKLKISYIPKPYILGISLTGGYTAYKLLQPFYFGGCIEPHIGIPQKKFPYKYEINGQPISGPLIIGGKLYAPFGICVYPFQENIEVFAELEPGIAFNMLWNTKFGKDSITSKLYPSFYGAFRTGASYKGFSAYIEANYDAILGFGFSLGVGYNINVSFAPSTQNND